MNEWEKRIREWLTTEHQVSPSFADGLVKLISQELEKAREEGRQEGLKDRSSVRGYLMGHGAGTAEERQRIIQLIEGMMKQHLDQCVWNEDGYGHKFRDCDSECQANGFNQALETLKKQLTETITI